MPSRLAKNNALRAINSTKEKDAEDELEVLEEATNSKEFIVPMYSQNAPEGYSLDLFKQYKRRMDFCDRELIRIHDVSLNENDKGSKDKGLIYIDFNAAMFEALKVNFLNYLKNSFGIILIADPKVEFYGQALERVCLDLRMNICNMTHDVKIKVHNTMCSIDVAGFHDEVAKRFNHLHNLTVGEYFANHIIANIVEVIDTTVDISKLNEHLRLLASEGKRNVKLQSTKQSCKSCNKDAKKSPLLTCNSCKETLHITCLPNSFSGEKDLAIKTNYTCGDCLVYPNRKITAVALTNDNDNLEQQLTDLKLSVILPSSSSDLLSIQHSPSEQSSQEAAVPSSIMSENEQNFSCDKCNFISKDKENLNTHKKDFHKIKCTECDLEFVDKDELEQHIQNGHDKRGSKRSRGDTSLIYDGKVCGKCDQLDTENRNLRTQIESLNLAIVEGKKKVDELSKELEEKCQLVQKVTKELDEAKSTQADITVQQALQKKNEEYELLKQMVIDRDKTMKKNEESHKKEISILQVGKKASDDALDRVTQENTLLKDKESTLMDIFKCMKEYTNTHALEKPGTEILHSCDKCMKNFNSDQTLKDHICQTLNATDQNIMTSQIFNCDECGFTDKIEENVLNHKIAVHTKHYCNKCGFITETMEDLMNHLHTKHTEKQINSKEFNCRKCSSTFSTITDLNIHSRTHVKPDNLPCNYCGYKASSFEALDIHIASFHKIQKLNSISNNQLHQNTLHKKRYTAHERLDNGACRNWNTGFCKFNEFCKYAHIKLCKFQERCRSPLNCRYYHENRNSSFLRTPAQSQSFQFRQQDFPPLQGRGQRRL